MVQLPCPIPSLLLQTSDAFAPSRRWTNIHQTGRFYLSLGASPKRSEHRADTRPRARTFLLSSALTSQKREKTRRKEGYHRRPPRGPGRTARAAAAARPSPPAPHSRRPGAAARCPPPHRPPPSPSPAWGPPAAAGHRSSPWPRAAASRAAAARGSGTGTAPGRGRRRRPRPGRLPGGTGERAVPPTQPHPGLRRQTGVCNQRRVPGGRGVPNAAPSESRAIKPPSGICPPTAPTAASRPEPKATRSPHQPPSGPALTQLSAAGLEPFRRCRVGRVQQQPQEALAVGGANFLVLKCHCWNGVSEH